MCGIAAWTGVWRTEDVGALLRLAAQRGPHAWGLASLEWRSVALGRYDGLLPARVPTEGALLGHARLATSAGRTDLEAVQPLVVGPLAIAHNGTVPDAAEWPVPWPTGNDSEVIGQWLVRQLEPMPVRLRGLAVRLRRPYALAVLAGSEVWLMRRGHPLWVRPGFACSRPFEGAAQLLEEDAPFRLTPATVVLAAAGAVAHRCN